LFSGPNLPTSVDLDPTRYDVDELREVADGEFPDAEFEERVMEHGFLWSEPSGYRLLGVEDPTPEQHERLLELEGIEASDLGQKPYLQSLPDEEGVDEAVFDWLEFLSATGGYEGTLDALARYRTLGWITEDVEEELRGYMLGVGRREGDGLEAFDRSDHLLSFAYVARLVSMA